MSACSRKRKDDCKSSKNCYWIVNKGCYKKRYRIPQWEELLSKKYTVDISKIPLIRTENHGASLFNELAINWLEKKYSSKLRQVCFVKSENDMMIWGPVDEKQSEPPKYDLHVPDSIRREIQKCIDNKSNVVIINYRLFSESNKDRSHRNVIILNKFLKTIELYDPNGGSFHIKRYKSEDVPLLKKFFKTFPGLKGYRIVNYDDIWKKGFQYYENKAIQLLNEKGKCMIWSVFLAELRIRYYMINPEELFQELLNQIDNGEKPEYLKQFIKEYMMYIQKQIDPVHSPHIYSLISLSAKDAYKYQKNVRPSYEPLWDRRADYNKLFEISLMYLQEKYPNVCVAFIPTDGQISDKLLAWIDLRLIGENKFEELKSEQDIIVQMTNNKETGLYICPLIRRMILDCLKDETKQVIIVPIAFIRGRKGHLSGHKINLVINNYLKTIELYDSNGAKSHTKMFGDIEIPYIQKFIRSIPKIRDYRFFDYKSINPDAGFQSFEGIARKQQDLKTERAKCAFWATFLADIRCKYYYIEPDLMIKQIIDKIEENDRPDVFYNIIKDYITYVDMKLKERILN